MKTIQHPLSDPASNYNRLRAGYEIEEKTRGYFYWLKARHRRQKRAQTTNSMNGLSHILEGLAADGGLRAARGLNVLRTAVGHISLFGPREARDHDAVTAMAWSHDGRVVWGTHSGTIRVAEPANCGAVSTAYRHQTYVSRLVSSPWENVVVSLDAGGEVVAYDLASDNISTMPQFRTRVEALACLRGGRAVCGAADGSLVIWDPCGAQSMREIGKCADAIRSVVALSDETVATGDAAGIVTIWNLDTGAARTTRLHTRAVRFLVKGPGLWVTSGSDDRTVAVWYYQSDRVITMKQHSGPVTALAVLDEHHVISGSEDSAVILWNVEADEITSLKEHTKWVTAVQAFREGSVVSGSWDGTVRLWHPDQETVSTLDQVDTPVAALAASSDNGVVFGTTDGCVHWLPPTADGGPTVHVSEMKCSNESFELSMVSLPPQAVCRALLIDEYMVENLREAVGVTPNESGEEVLRRSLEPQCLSGNLDVARILSGVPELNGVVDDEGCVTLVAKVPPDSPSLLASTFIVVITDTTG